MLKRNIIPFIFLLFSLKLFAHPHIFIDYEAKFHFKEKQVDSIDIVWMFEKLSSHSMYSAFDRNNNGKLDKKEYVELKNNTYESIKSKKFFAEFIVNDKKIVIDDIENFKVVLTEDKLLKYDFKIPCNLKLDQAKNNIRLYFNDRVFYAAFTCSQKEIVYENDGSLLINKTKIKDGSEQILDIELK